MTSFKSLMNPFKPSENSKINVKPVEEIIETIYKPLMVMYNLNMGVEGEIKIKTIPKLIEITLLVWILEIFGKNEDWSGGAGYVWKSMTGKILETLDVHMSSSDSCCMLSSKCDYTGFTDGSCVPSHLIRTTFDGSRSWELMSVDGHLIIITLKYKLTIQPFNHEIRDNLRNHGFMKLGLLTPEEIKLMKYIGLKNQKLYYTHEKAFEKLLSRLKGPKNPRVRATIIFHDEIQPENYNPLSPTPSAPPLYNNDPDI